MSNFLKIFLLILLLVLGLRFFNLFFLRNFSPSNTIMLVLSCFPFLLYLATHKSYFYFQKEIKNIYVFCFITMLVCWVSRGQSILESLPLYVEILSLGLYVLFLNIKVDLKVMDCILFVLCMIASVLYIVQFYIYPYPLCLDPESINDYLSDTTNSRFRMTGQSLISLGLVMGYVKFLQKRQLHNFLLAVVSFYALFLMGFRSIAMLSVLFVAGGIFFTFKFNLRTILSVALLCIVSFYFVQSDMFSTIFEHMKERNETENFSNGSYIRVTQLRYWFTEHYQNILEVFFGSGFPNPTTDYGKYMQMLDNRGINYFDFGIFSFIFVIGVAPVFFMMKYCFKALCAKVPHDYKYLGIWLVFLLSISFLSTEFFRQGCMTIQAYVLAMITIANKKNK